VIAGFVGLRYKKSALEPRIACFSGYDPSGTDYNKAHSLVDFPVCRLISH